MVRSAHRLMMLAVVAGTWSVSSLSAQDVLTVAPQSVQVIFENEHARVIRERLAPGQQLPMHSHPGRVTFAIADSRLNLADAAGGSAIQETRAGDVTWSDPITHSVANNGAGEAEYISFEIKAPATRDFASSTSMMGGTIAVLVDSAQVRVLDVRLAPKEKAIPAQAANRLVFALSPYRAVAEFDARTRNRIESDLHTIQFLGEGLDTIENTGRNEMHVLVVELK